MSDKPFPLEVFVTTPDVAVLLMQLAQARADVDTLTRENTELKATLVEVQNISAEASAQSIERLNRIRSEVDQFHAKCQTMCNQRDLVVGALRKLVLALKPCSYQSERPKDAVVLTLAEKEADELLTVIDQLQKKK